ncbi:segregation and condensation protein A [Acidiphilium sp.]|uniref:segregation and condensation protein A n=1 Tax=Acidiphilium sp. TaxID=527 RepID=UPI003D040329
MPATEPVTPDAGPTEAFIVQLEGFEGPLDLLLDLARAQKFDLASISILALVDQYLAIIEGARKIRLELAADWLVMAAWLAWLKSRLLLPDPEAIEDAELSADILADRLRALEAIRAAAAWLNQQPQLGLDVFPRGMPEDFTEFDRSRLKLDLPSLLAGYLAARRRSGAKRQYRPKPVTYWTVQQALERLTRLIGATSDWSNLESFLPDSPQSPLAHRAALSSTLLASLELARSGVLTLRQDQDFAPILLRAAGANLTP